MRAVRKRQSPGVLFIEVLLVSSLPGLVRIIVPDLSPTVSATLYAMVIPAITAFSGFRWGAVSAAVLAVDTFALILLPKYMPSILAIQPLGAFFYVLMLASLAASLIVSFARNRILLFKTRLLGRYRTAIHSLVSLRKRSEVFEKVNRVLEGRVSSQKDSITILHDQVKKLASLNLEQALETILETVALFTDMSSGSIWTLDEGKRVLIPVAARGWHNNARRDVTLDPDKSIEGYVLRNRKMFSVRMLLDGSEFDRFDTGRTIIAMPIIIGSKSWGVIDVEDLPFERYSQYTETILAIMLSLSEPYLRRITEYESLNAQNDVDPDTGHPLFTILHKTINSDLERMHYEPGFVSLVVLEISNFEELLEKCSREQVKKMLFSLKHHIDSVKKMKSKAFHFKEDSQLVLLMYDLDQDGTSFFCLDLLAMLSEYHFEVDDTVMPVEMIIGFSSSAQYSDNADSMISAAEHLLSIQRL